MPFDYPAALILLVIPLGLAVHAVRYRGHPSPLPFDHGRGRPRYLLQWSLSAAALAPALALAAAVVMIAAPHSASMLIYSHSDKNIQICLDVSNSMDWAIEGESDRVLPDDERPTRFKEARASLKTLTERRPHDTFGLIVFGSVAIPWVPLTHDLAALRRVADMLNPSGLPEDFRGTRIIKALEVASDELVKVNVGERVVILITDGGGEDLEGSDATEIAWNLARHLKRLRIRVDVIHISRDPVLEPIIAIARGTDGEVIKAVDQAELARVIDRLSLVQEGVETVQELVTTTDLRPWAVGGLALTLISAACLLGLRYSPW